MTNQFPCAPRGRTNAPERVYLVSDLFKMVRVYAGPHTALMIGLVAEHEGTAKPVLQHQLVRSDHFSPDTQVSVTARIAGVRPDKAAALRDRYSLSQHPRDELSVRHGGAGHQRAPGGQFQFGMHSERALKRLPGRQLAAGTSRPGSGRHSPDRIARTAVSHVAVLVAGMRSS